MEQGIVSGSLSRGWEVFKTEGLRVWGYLIVSFIVLGLVSGVSGFFVENAFTQFVLNLAIGVVMAPFTYGIYYGLLQIVRGESVTLSGALEHAFSRGADLMMVSLATSVIFYVGTLLLIVPGIIAALGLMATPFLVLDRGLDWRSAMKASWEMMTGYKGSYFVLGLVAVGITIVSMIPLGLGLLVSLPVITLAWLAFYDRVLTVHPPSISGPHGAEPPLFE
jgi:uncharacterized membrane protein